MSTLYDFDAVDILGQNRSLSEFKGQTVLVVNVASYCGYTPQYEGLEQLHRKYGTRGLVVLGFPCNQFGAQEPGTHEEIVEFCTANYGVSFPLFAKADVTGEGKQPLYAALTAASRAFDGAWPRTPPTERGRELQVQDRGTHKISTTGTDLPNDGIPF